ADLAVGAWQSGAGGAAAGRAAVISGRDGREILSLACLVPGETFGFDATAVGDLDGDGGGDFLFTAAYSGYGGPRTGRAFVIAGPVPTPAPPSAPAR
ncbi:MAG: hypothetical protein HUU06_07170, partial [Planctomycetaceae bacterium]|nr:hypothetical protein [Planctomycetaceae bacterium]